MRRGLRAKAVLAQQSKDLPMHGPDGHLLHLNQQVVLLGASSDRNCEGKAPVSDGGFQWLGRFEQTLVHVLQFCCECLLLGNQLLRCDLIGAFEQSGQLLVDPERHVLCTDLSPRNSKHVGADDASHDDLQMFNLCVPIPLVVDARSPNSFGQDEGSRGHDRYSTTYGRTPCQNG